MKKFLLIAMMAFATLTSCQKDESFNQNDIVGEWKATKIEATMSDGRVVTITDFDVISDELEGFEWITITKNFIRVQAHKADVHVPDDHFLLYNISDNFIVFEEGDTEATYYLQSVTKNEMVIKYTSSWNSLIYYTKMK